MTVLTRTEQTTHPLVEQVAKVCGQDEGTARVLVELALYESLCTEVDRLQPGLDEVVAKMISKTAARSLQNLSKSTHAASPEAALAAEALYSLVQIGKADNPNTPYWDHRVKGRFAADSGRATTGLANGMDILTAPRDSKLGEKSGAVLGDLVGRDATNYSRARSIGNGLTAMNSPEARALGTLAHVIGEIGPEAQAALEPGIRRTAYRYRGTERRPGKELRSAAILGRLAEGKFPEPESEAGQLVGQWSAELRDHSNRAAMQTAGLRGGGPRETLSPEALAYGLVMHEAQGKGSRTPDQVRLDAVGEFAVLSLRKQIPDLELAAISRAAGKMPPSVGLLIDKDGKVVSEAQGFNGDHYLPFDLKNLKSLKGGQYARTRAQGGPTDEDIYTGLLTGARQIQVVSNSGVFTLEFDPDLRGGRRHSDKARQMVGRYAALVGKIESGELEQNPLPREQIKLLEKEALEEANGNVDLANTYLADKKRDAIAAAKYSGIDDEALRAQAKQVADSEWAHGQAIGGNKPKTSNRTRLQTEKQVYNQLRQEALDKTYRTYQANGEGYFAAMRALKQEFPYFIRRVKHETLGDYLVDRDQLAANEKIPGRGGRDQGYTERGALRSKGTAEAGSKKTAAQLRGGKGAAGAAPEVEEAVTDGGVAAPAAGAAAAPGFGAALGGSAPAARPTSAGGREKAKSFEELAAAPPPELRRSLNNALSASLKARNNMALDETPPGETLESIKGVQNLEQWSGFFANPAFMGTAKTTDWLLHDADEADLEKMVNALTALKGFREQADPADAVLKPYPVEGFDAAIDMVNKLKALRKPFATPTGAGHLALEDPSFDPNPQPFPDILGEGASSKNLAAFAAEHKDIKAAADAFTDKSDEEIADEIGQDVERYTRLASLDPAQARSPEEAKAAKLVQSGKENSPEFKSLEVKQKAWALKRATHLAAFAAGAESPPFAKRLRQPLAVHDRQSAIAKAYAARLRAKR